MAVTATFTRSRHATTVPLVTEILAAALSGTYATGGFTWNPFAVTNGLGSSPLSTSPTSTAYGATWFSPTGYTYATTFSGSGSSTTATTKIYTSGGTELANLASLPDATLNLAFFYGR